MSSASSSGVAFSISSVDAPTRSGKTTRPPSPKVKASGGVPVKTSSAVGRSTWRENVSAMASTSRWKCIVAFGRPVVPEVKASSATSSAAVSTSSNVSGLTRQRVGEAAVAAVGDDAQSDVEPPRWSSTNRWSHRRERRSGRSRGSVASSPARSSGIVVTATAPAFSTPNQHATSQGLFGPRSSTRLPGTMPRSSTSTCAIWLATAEQVAVRPRARRRRKQARAVGAESLDHVVQQLGRAVQPVGVVQLGQVEEELGPLVRRRQVVAAERVDVGGRAQLHPGNVCARFQRPSRARHTARRPRRCGSARQNGGVPLYQDEAIVLRTHKLGEADRIITMLSRSHGRVRASRQGRTPDDVTLGIATRTVHPCRSAAGRGAEPRRDHPGRDADAVPFARAAGSGLRALHRRHGHAGDRGPPGDRGEGARGPAVPAARRRAPG